MFNFQGSFYSTFDAWLSFFRKHPLLHLHRNLENRVRTKGKKALKRYTDLQFIFLKCIKKLDN